MLDQIFGRLYVTHPAGRNADGKRQWFCQCVCGRTKIIAERSLRIGASKSCGCLAAELSAQRTSARKKHGHCPKSGMSPTRYSWRSMLTRCLNPKATQYKNYGARGIAVCDRWMEFSNFLADMGERPEGTTLDRINNDDGYKPGNCRWATALEQAANRRPMKPRAV